MPESPNPNPIGMLYFKVFQEVRLSPDQVCTYCCIPGQPAREIKNGRWSGFASSWASYEARIIINVCSGRANPIGMV